jgi:hypothetical protein
VLAGVGPAGVDAAVAGAEVAEAGAVVGVAGAVVGGAVVGVAAAVVGVAGSVVGVAGRLAVLMPVAGDRWALMLLVWLHPAAQHAAARTAAASINARRSGHCLMADPCPRRCPPGGERLPASSQTRAQRAGHHPAQVISGGAFRARGRAGRAISSKDGPTRARRSGSADTWPDRGGSWSS